MNNRNGLFLLVILNTLLFVMPGGCYRMSTLTDNCTCVTSEGIYSLFWLRRTDGKPRFSVSGFPQGYTYTYNPCVPYNITSSKGSCSCINVALCMYDTGGDPPDYINIGEQKDVQCEVSRDGKIALVYHARQYTPRFPRLESRVKLECNNDPEADPTFSLVDEDNLIFQLTSFCGCPNKCLPTYPTTKGPNPSIKTTSSQREDRIVPVKETNHAVKHEKAWAKGKGKDRLQEDAGEEYSFAGKGDENVLI